MDFTKLFLISALLCQACASPIGIKESPIHADGIQPITGRAAAPPIHPGNVVNVINEDTASIGFNQPAAAAACTVTLDRPTWNCPSWDGTFTIYPSAVLQYTSVNCKGCDHVDANDIHFCPNMQVTATRTESTPSTFWSTVCAVSTGLALAAEPAVAAITPASIHIRARMADPGPAPVPITAAPTPTAGLELRQGGVVVLQPAPAACPTTLVIKPEQSAGKTLITHSKYTTTTVLVSCGGCPLVLSTALLGYGPPGAFSKTVTSSMGTKTSYACL